MKTQKQQTPLICETTPNPRKKKKIECMLPIHAYKHEFGTNEKRTAV